MQRTPQACGARQINECGLRRIACISQSSIVAPMCYPILITHGACRGMRRRSLTARILCVCRGFSGPGGGPCEECPPGTFRALYDLGACQLCPAGKTGAGTISLPTGGLTSCKSCTPGSYQPREGVMYEYCPVCPAGKAGTVSGAESNVSGCNVVCAPGTFTDGTKKSTSCEPCAQGTYSDENATGKKSPSKI